MKNTRVRKAAAGLGLALALALTGCSAVGTGTATTSATGGTAVEAETAAATSENTADHDEPSDYEWDAADEVAIEFTGSTAASADDAVVVDGGTVTITAAGTYRVSGALSDGQVVVDTEDEGVVRLVLDGVDITSSTGAALAVLDAEKAVVILAEGTENSLTDAAEYVFPDAETDEPNAALFSAADLTIGGTGSLSATGRYNDGIASKDGLVISGGTVTVDAVDDGIRGKDYLVVRGTADLTVSAGGDGLKADNADDAASGYVAIEAGTLAITSGVDGIDATTDARIAGGDLTITAGDDAVHADATLAVSGGSLTVTEAYEGLESLQITVSGGEIEIHAEDDGINVAGGVDGSGQQAATDRQAGAPGGAGGPGGDQFATLADAWVAISGGTTVIYSGGDGFDSNGSASMTGGTLIVHGPTSDGNGAVDVNGAFTVDGGVLLAAGSAGMAETPDDSSGQAVLGIAFGTPVSAGTEVLVLAPDGTAVLTFTPAKDAATLVASSPDLVSGTAYDVVVGGTGLGTVTAS